MIYVDEEDIQVTFDIEVEFEVSVTGPDFANGIYDREEGRMFTFDSTTRTEIINELYTVEIGLSYKLQDQRICDIEEVDFSIAGVLGGIEVSVEEYEEHWD